MQYQSTAEKLQYLNDHIGADPSHFYGNYYRAAARLTDGTFLPCVRFLNPRYKIKSAIGLLERARKGEYTADGSAELAYQGEMRNLVVAGNRVNHYDIARIEPSRYAFPPEILNQIKGETTMGYTGFSVRMSDGKYFGFGTQQSFDFFGMPDGYTKADIREIINHSYVLKTGELRRHQLAFLTPPPDYADAVVHWSMLGFECFMDDL